MPMIIVDLMDDVFLALGPAIIPTKESFDFWSIFRAD